MAISGDWQRGAAGKRGRRIGAISRSDIPLDRRRRPIKREREEGREEDEEGGVSGFRSKS